MMDPRALFPNQMTDQVPGDMAAHQQAAQPEQVSQTAPLNPADFSGEFPDAAVAEQSETIPAEANTELAEDTLEHSMAMMEDLFQANPIEAIVMIAADVANELIEERLGNQLSTLKDEAELRGALVAFRKMNPDGGEFEPFVLQEVANILQGEQGDDHANDDWQDLLSMGLKAFQSKLRETVSQQHPSSDNEEDASKTTEAMLAKTPFMEGGKARKMPEAMPHFTRQQIAAMSPDEFLKNESAIELAMKHGRIR